MIPEEIDTWDDLCLWLSIRLTRLGAYYSVPAIYAWRRSAERD